MLNRYLSPTGSEIVGTLESLSGVGLITGIESRDGQPDYSGETEVWWDDQRTVTRDGHIVFVDADGAQWLFHQLRLA